MLLRDVPFPVKRFTSAGAVLQIKGFAISLVRQAIALSTFSPEKPQDREKNMMLRSLCAAVFLDGMTSMACAEPVDLAPAQMDAVTAASADSNNAYALAEASASGENALTGTFANAVALNGLLPKLPAFGGGSQAGAIAAATGPSTSIEASARAGYELGGEAIGLAVAMGAFAFTAISAGVVNINEQDYLVGSLAGSDGSSVKAVTTAPIALSASGIAWSPPLRPAASAPPLSETSTEVPGGLLVTYTLTTGDQTGDHATVSLTFFKPPRSHIPPMIPIDISGVVPVMSTALHAIPVAM